MCDMRQAGIFADDSRVMAAAWRAIPRRVYPITRNGSPCEIAVRLPVVCDFADAAPGVM